MLDEQYVAVPESYLAPEWRDWAAQPPATTRHGIDNTARALEALQNTTPSLKQNGLTRTEKNRHFHKIIEKFLQQREEDRERPAPVALKIREKKGSQKYVDITKQDTESLLQAFLNIQQQQQQQQPQSPQKPYPQTPTTSKEKKKKKKQPSTAKVYHKLSPYHKSMMTRQKKQDNAYKLLQEQTGTGYLSNSDTIRPVHFTSLFSGKSTVLL